MSRADKRNKGGRPKIKNKDGTYKNKRYVKPSERVPYEMKEEIYKKLEKCYDVIFMSILSQSDFTDKMITKMNDKILSEVTDPNVALEHVAHVILDGQSRQIEKIDKLNELLNKDVTKDSI